mmetsp:Transcript_102206/g.142273  ORF Transcript_102206/g.142273 Transcript_102206/m.142273 type:complete len:294 (-) Transcript_102206:56-937(-)
MHLNGEHLTGAGVGGSVGGQEDHLISGLGRALLDAASEHITGTLDGVHARDGDTEGTRTVAVGSLDHVLKGVQKAVHVHLILEAGDLDVNTLPPLHVLRGANQVVSLEARDGDDGHRLGNEVLLPSDASEHTPHFVPDLFIALLRVLGEIIVHLVDGNNELLDTQQVDEQGVLPGLALNFTGLGVALGNGGGKVTIGGHQQHGDIGLRRTGDHVLDEIPVAGGINDGVVLGLREELLGGAGDCYTTGSLILLLVHEEGKSERGLSEGVGLLLKLLQLTRVKTSELEEQMSGCG